MASSDVFRIKHKHEDAGPLSSRVSLVILLLPLHCWGLCGEVPKDFHPQPKTILVNITQQYRKNILFSCRGEKEPHGNSAKGGLPLLPDCTPCVCPSHRLLQIIRDQNHRMTVKLEHSTYLSEHILTHQSVEAMILAIHN